MRPANTLITRPNPDEYASRFAVYIAQVAAEDALQALAEQRRETLQLFDSLSDERALFRYAPDKWSLKEVLGHVIDTERIFAYRALRFARGDRTPLPGFDQDDYVRAARFDARPLEDLRDEYDSVRCATLTLFRGLDEEELARCGTANQAEATVRALAYVIAGHERHHLRVIRERYLKRV
ncbi:MAG: hypothetical protein C4334_10225 [Pyrinomonas sp.]|uniref:DinB family protein n=1 Tax=Pyrinomonas sp. TaxID=2080306 RepID=UPI00331DB046